MKAIMLVTFLIMVSAGEWMTDFEKARETAARENKLILLNFSGSDWCGPCIKMKREIFESEAFRQFAAGNLVLLRADFPRLKKNQPEPSLKEQNEKLAARYNAQGRFPLTLLLNEQGDVIAQWDGYKTQTPEAFVDALKNAAAR